jgi:hypothetical protein
MLTGTTSFEQPQIAGKGSLVLNPDIVPPTVASPEYPQAEHANGFTCPIFHLPSSAFVRYHRIDVQAVPHLPLGHY